MFWQIIFFLSSTHALRHTLQEPACTTEGTSRTIRLSVNSTRQSTGDWMDSLSAWTEVSNSTNTTQMDISHTITECQGKRVIYIMGLSQAPKNKEKKDTLRFHPRCGSNIEILNEGLTVRRFKGVNYLYTWAFTNRALRDEEIFEVKLEEKANGDSIGIGIITKSPTDIELVQEIYFSPSAWMYHDKNIWNNRKIVKSDYGKNTGTFQNGDRVGVMRSKAGTLHFFYNGKDQGPAISNVPPNVYGVLEVRGDFEKASIV